MPMGLRQGWGEGSSSRSPNDLVGSPRKFSLRAMVTTLCADIWAPMAASQEGWRGGVESRVFLPPQRWVRDSQAQIPAPQPHAVHPWAILGQIPVPL